MKTAPYGWDVGKEPFEKSIQKVLLRAQKYMGTD
jgi:hypothetical protein